MPAVSAVLASWLTATPARCADESELPQVESLELDKIYEPYVPGGNRRVVVRDAQGREVVAKIHLEGVGRSIIIQPDGSLGMVESDGLATTGREFEAADEKELARTLRMGPLRRFKSRTTRHYLFIYNTSDTFQKATSVILETMFQPLYLYFKRQKFDVHTLDYPLVVVMFETEKEFRTYRPVDDSVTAYYDPIRNHVVMFEQSELAEMAPELAIKQTISTIAHEGVHQVLSNIGVQQRLSNWPMWVGEGLADYFAPTSVDRGARWRGVGKVNNLRMKELEDYFKPSGNQADGQIIKDMVSASTLTSADYARSWALVHLLFQRHRDEMFAYLKDVSRVKPLEWLDPPEPSLFTRHFGHDFAAIEADLVKHLKRLPYVDPILNQTHYVVMLEIVEGNVVTRLVGITPSQKSARDWRYEQTVDLAKKPKARGKFGIRVFSNRRTAAGFANRWLGGR